MADPGASEEDTGHSQHDPELIVALLDRDLADAGRASAEARILACPACASLHEDLVALARASIELSTPSRPRDFTLTPQVAAALARAAVGEPAPDRTRLSGEMTDSRSTHADHDRLLLANLVDRSPSDGERARADEQMAACRECALLYDDLVALSTAIRAMPIPSRPRDFTLTRADADRLRVRGWRRLLAAIGSSRDVFSRPLAMSLTTLGLAGLLVATIPGALPGLTGGSTSAPAAEDAARNAAGNAPAASPEFLTQASPAASAAPASGPAIVAVPSAAPSEAALPAPAASAADASPEVLVEGGETGSVAGEPEDRGAFDAYLKSLGDETGGPSPMMVLAALLLVAGLGLFGLRWTARRLRDG